MKKTMLIIVVLTISLFAFAFVGCNAIELSDPENIRYDGMVITWNAVENADGYTVRIDGGEEYTVTVPSFPYVATSTQFNVTIRAFSKASKIVQSGESVKTFVSLGNVENIRFSNDGIPSWDPISGKDIFYIVKIDGTEEMVSDGSTTYLGMKPGRHSFQVKAVALDDSYFSIWSDPISVNILEPVSKDDIEYSDGLISWGYVSGARYYELYVNGAMLAAECKETSFSYDAKNKNFEVMIRAIGDRQETYDSQLSEVKKFVYLSTVSDMFVSDGIVRWSPITGADGYKIKLNSVELDEVLSEPSFDRLTPNVTTSVSVKPITNDTTYFSDWSVEKSVMILPQPVLRWEGSYAPDETVTNNTVWDGVSGATGYAVRLTSPDGKETIKTYDISQRNFGDPFEQVGTYKVEVKALAGTSGTNIYDSRYSTPITVNRLAAPTRPSENFITSDPNNVGEGFTVTFDKVTEASGYCLYSGKTEIQRGTTNQFAVRGIVETGVVEEQTFNYRIQSLGGIRTENGAYYVTLDSMSKDAMSFAITVLAMPQNVTMSGTMVSYGAISKNNGYTVDVGGQSFTSGTTQYDLDVLEAGEYDVKVCARGNGADILASNYSAAIKVCRLEAPTNIRIDTSDASEGVLTYSTVEHAQGYYVVFDNNGEAVPVNELGNINRRISEDGTAIFMTSSANYYNSDKTVYYMTSRPSATSTFIKLAAPTFGDVAFTNDQFIWKAPSNINTQVYTPTYEVYDANKLKYNGEKNGTTLDISELEGGKEYTFYVKAIGDGKNYVNSELSKVKTIWKLASPDVDRGDGCYEWSGVYNAINYVVYVGGKAEQHYTHTSQTAKYTFTPKFTDPTEYRVEVVAVGDGGYTSIDSDPKVIVQKTKQLDMPDFKFSYSGEYYDDNGTINVTVTKPSPNSRGYRYIIGGTEHDSVDTSYSYAPHSVGKYSIRVTALGGNFDEEGVYYLDSQSKGGGSEHTLVLLACPNQSSINLTNDGFLSWTAISDALGYTLEISVAGEETKTIEVSSASYTIKDFADYKGKQITVKIRAKGNGTTIISSQQVERSWTISQ